MRALTNQIADIFSPNDNNITYTMNSVIYYYSLKCSVSFTHIQKHE